MSNQANNTHNNNGHQNVKNQKSTVNNPSGTSDPSSKILIINSLNKHLIKRQETHNRTRNQNRRSGVGKNFNNNAIVAECQYQVDVNQPKGIGDSANQQNGQE